MAASRTHIHAPRTQPLIVNLVVILFWATILCMTITRIAMQRAPTKRMATAIQARDGEQPVDGSLNNAPREHAHQDHHKSLIDPGVIEVAIAVTGVGFAIRTLTPDLSYINIVIPRWLLYELPLSIQFLGSLVFTLGAFASLTLYYLYLLERRNRNMYSIASPSLRRMAGIAHWLLFFTILIILFTLASFA